MMSPFRRGLFVLAAVALLAGAAPAQDVLLQQEHVAGRTKAGQQLALMVKETSGTKPEEVAARLEGAMTSARAQADLLVQGSAARKRLDAALARAADLAKEQGPAAALAHLRGEANELAEELVFQPMMEAEMPADFPTYRGLGEIELREYPTYRMARATMRGRGATMGSFWTLFQHIQKNDIAMTAPVQVDYVVTEQGEREGSMAFLYGSPEVGPAGNAGKVEVVDVPKITVLSIGSRGNDSGARIEEMSQSMRDWVAANATTWEVAGPIRTMGYNGPSVRGDKRYFEVQLPVRKVEKPANTPAPAK
jgi:hypothetical protein